MPDTYRDMPSGENHFYLGCEANGERFSEFIGEKNNLLWNPGYFVIYEEDPGGLTEP